ncbi:hypothetical protein B7R21_14935 [Subtercola boreus]|uniref:Uncharacterized protein n=1 Tax=Subtercola boreus TaxID=120213 RepID=A0A3E0VF50_9MICO|nr:hypothetical protein B7R21_14935 [Subtercola boreus]
MNEVVAPSSSQTARALLFEAVAAYSALPTAPTLVGAARGTVPAASSICPYWAADWRPVTVKSPAGWMSIPSRDSRSLSVPGYFVAAGRGAATPVGSSGTIEPAVGGDSWVSPPNSETRPDTWR